MFKFGVSENLFSDLSFPCFVTDFLARDMAALSASSQPLLLQPSVPCGATNDANVAIAFVGPPGSDKRRLREELREPGSDKSDCEGTTFHTASYPFMDEAAYGEAGPKLRDVPACRCAEEAIAREVFMRTPTEQQEQLLQSLPYQLATEVKGLKSEASQEKTFVTLIVCDGNPTSAAGFSASQTVFIFTLNSVVPLNTCIDANSSPRLHRDYVLPYLSAIDAISQPHVKGCKLYLLIVGFRSSAADDYRIPESELEELLQPFKEEFHEVQQIFLDIHSDLSDFRKTVFRCVTEKKAELEEHRRSLPFLTMEWLMLNPEFRFEEKDYLTFEEFSRVAHENLSVSLTNEETLLDFADDLHSNGVIRSFHHRKHGKQSFVFHNKTWLLKQLARVSSLAPRQLPKPDHMRKRNLLKIKWTGVLSNEVCDQILMWHPSLREPFLDILQQMKLVYNHKNPALRFAPIAIEQLSERLPPIDLNHKMEPMLLRFANTAATDQILQEILSTIRQRLRPDGVVDNGHYFLRFRLAKLPELSHLIDRYFAEIFSIRQGIIINLRSGLQAQDLQYVANKFLQQLDKILQEWSKRISGQELAWSPAFICHTSPCAGEPKEN